MQRLIFVAFTKTKILQGRQEEQKTPLKNVANHIQTGLFCGFPQAGDGRKEDQSFSSFFPPSLTPPSRPSYQNKENNSTSIIQNNTNKTDFDRPHFNESRVHQRPQVRGQQPYMSISRTYPTYPSYNQEHQPGHNSSISYKFGLSIYNDKV